MKTLIIKSLLTSFYKREEIYPSLAKRGVGRFSNNDALLIYALVIQKDSGQPRMTEIGMKVCFCF
jgi:hypothetical protein